MEETALNFSLLLAFNCCLSPVSSDFYTSVLGMVVGGDAGAGGVGHVRRNLRHEMKKKLLSLGLLEGLN